ncbi:MAG: ATP-grasp domain-containing protein [Chitinophagaceae bacterium]|nr:ATP-grasp domain-containing protein [Chitinophagaceae bacterium]
MNVLLSCAGRRNYLVNYFKMALGGRGKVVATDMQINAPALVDADIAVKVSAVYHPQYIDQIIKVCKDYDIHLLIPLNDLELPILAAQKHRFAEIGVKVVISDTAVIDTCFDKWKTTVFLQDTGLKTPQTFIDLNKAIEAIDRGELLFPVVVKPRWGSASIGIEFSDSKEELLLAYQLLNLRLHKTILAKVSEADIHHAILIQEKLVGQEYGMDVLNDFSGAFVKAFPKKKLAMRAGETDKALSVQNDVLSDIGKVLGNKLKHIGNLDCDIFETKNGYYVLELNPRFGGGYPFTHEAGADFPSVLVEWAKGNNKVESFLHFRVEEAFSKCDRLLKVPDGK